MLTGTSACNAASKLSNSFPSNARVRVIKSIGSAISFRLFSAKILLLRNQLSIVY
jgi:hypothetical protein